MRTSKIVLTSRFFGFLLILFFGTCFFQFPAIAGCDWISLAVDRDSHYTHLLKFLEGKPAYFPPDLPRMEALTSLLRYTAYPSGFTESQWAELARFVNAQFTAIEYFDKLEQGAHFETDRARHREQKIDAAETLVYFVHDAFLRYNTEKLPKREQEIRRAVPNAFAEASHPAPYVADKDKPSGRSLPWYLSPAPNPSIWGGTRPARSKPGRDVIHNDNIGGLGNSGWSGGPVIPW